MFATVRFADTPSPKAVHLYDRYRAWKTNRTVRLLRESAGQTPFDLGVMISTMDTRKRTQTIWNNLMANHKGEEVTFDINYVPDDTYDPYKLWEAFTGVSL